MDTIEYATFRYDTVKVENGLKALIVRSEDPPHDLKRKSKEESA